MKRVSQRRSEEEARRAVRRGLRPPCDAGASRDARKPGMTDEPKRLREEELHAIESALLDLRRTIAAGEFFEAERILRRPSLDASTVSRLIVEVRRLRTLVKDAAPYFDGMEADARGRGHEREIRQLQVRLRAEVTEGELD